MEGTLLAKKEYVWKKGIFITDGLPDTWSVSYRQIGILEIEHEIKVELTASSEILAAIDTVTYLDVKQQVMDPDNYEYGWSSLSDKPTLLITETDRQPNLILFFSSHFSDNFTGEIQFVFTAYMRKESPLSFGGYALSEENAANDQILVVEDHKFHVNKAVLSFYSPVFHTLFNNENFDESKKDEIELKELSAKQFEVLLQIVFPTTVTVNEENVEFLWILADRFGMSSVAQICESFLCRIEGKKLPSHLTLSNRLKIAQTHRSDKLMSAVCDAMKKMKI